MHFSLATIAAAAAFFAAVEAAPHGRHSRPHGTGASGPFPTGGFSGEGRPGGQNGTEGEGRGRGRGRGGQSGSGSFPTGALPSGELPQPTGGFSAAAFESGDSSFPTNFPQPSGGFGGQQPSGGFGGQQPSGGFGGFPQPSGGFGGQQPSGGFGGQQPSGGFGGQQPSGGFGGFPSNFPQPSGGFGEIPSGIFPSDGSFPTGFPGGDSPSGFPGAPSGGLSGPAPTAPPTLPTGGAGLSSVSFGFPSTIQGNINAAEDDDDDEDSDASATSAAPEATETSSSGDDDSSSAIASATGGSDDTPTSTTVAAPTGGSSGGNSTSGGSASATTTFPEAAGESTLSEPMVVTGEFDGGMVRFGRGVDCSGQSEGGDSDAVFQIEEGGTLKNVIIGADQSEGVHCMGACTIENVWWEAVCEDALTIKQESGTSTVNGGGAKGAEDKVIQHNGGGTVQISGFYVEDFGKLYRSCGNCDTMYERHVVIDGVVADGGSATFVGINSNYGDTATITNSCITNTKTICEEFEGNDTGDEPQSISTGPSSACIYTDADVTAC